MSVELYNANHSLKTTKYWVGANKAYPSGYLAKFKFSVPTGIDDGKYYIKIHDTTLYANGEKTPDYTRAEFQIEMTNLPASFYPSGSFSISNVKGHTLGANKIYVTVKVQANCPSDDNLGDYGHPDFGSQKENQDSRIPYILEQEGSKKECQKNWARLIQKIYGVNPLTCPKSF